MFWLKFSFQIFPQICICLQCFINAVKLLLAIMNINGLNSIWCSGRDILSFQSRISLMYRALLGSDQPLTLDQHSILVWIIHRH